MFIILYFVLYTHNVFSILQKPDIMSLDAQTKAEEGAAPRLEGVPPTLEGMAPRLEDMAPRLEGVTPRLEGVAPRLQGVPPRLEGVAPRLEDVTEGVATGPEIVATVDMPVESEGTATKLKDTDPSDVAGMSVKSLTAGTSNVVGGANNLNGPKTARTSGVVGGAADSAMTTSILDVRGGDLKSTTTATTLDEAGRATKVQSATTASILDVMSRTAKLRSAMTANILDIIGGTTNLETTTTTRTLDVLSGTTNATTASTLDVVGGPATNLKDMTRANTLDVIGGTIGAITATKPDVVGGVTKFSNAEESKLDGMTAATQDFTMPADGVTTADGAIAKSHGFTLDEESEDDISFLEKAAEAGTPERILSPISRVMEMVQFGKKNLASTDTRFLSSLQSELQQVCDSLSDDPEDQKGEL